MLKIYGSMLCPDCVKCRADLDAAGVPYEYHDFSRELPALKEFLNLRDSLPVFDEVRQRGAIGIPCIVEENGTVRLDWQCYVDQAEA